MKMNMKERLVAVFVFVMVIVMPARGHLGAVGHVQPASGAGESPDTHRALISRYCVTCHNESTRTAGLALDSLDLSQVGPHASTWEKVVRKLRGGVMPPVGRPRPTRMASEGLATWLEIELDRWAATHPNPGRKQAFHRLNRTEYQNTIRDLLALDIDVGSRLPPDDASYGFDNMAGSLRISQSALEQYLSVARTIKALFK